MPQDAWGALAAERRALRRATDAARLASYVYQDDPPQVLLLRQLAWAKAAAYPPNRKLDQETQAALLVEIENQTLFQKTDALPDNALSETVVETVPLSQIGEDRLLSKRRKVKDDTASDASSSWATLSSRASSSFTSVSGDSLDGELVDKFVGL